MTLIAKHEISKKVASIAFPLIFGVTLAVLTFGCQGSPVVSKPEQVPQEQWDAALSIENLNFNDPEQILEDVSYYSMPAGVPRPCFSNSFVIHLDSDDKHAAGEWLAPIEFSACWKEGKLVKVVIFAPDGTQIIDGLVGDSYTEEAQTYRYRMPSTAPIGEYRFQFSSESGRVEKRVNVYVPDSPHVYARYAEQKLILYGFQPREKMQIFVYHSENDYNYIFIGWFKTAVDKTGQIFVPIPDDFLLGYIVKGEKSGIVVHDGLNVYK